MLIIICIIIKLLTPLNKINKNHKINIKGKIYILSQSGLEDKLIYAKIYGIFLSATKLNKYWESGSASIIILWNHYIKRPKHKIDAILRYTSDVSRD